MPRRTKLRRFAAPFAGLLLLVCALAAASPAAAQPAQSDILGTLGTHRTRAEDSLTELARQLGLGYVELLAANPHVDPWLPGEGTSLVLPTARLLPPGPRRGIVINLAEMRLYVWPKDGPPESVPIGIGTDDRETLTGETRVVRKQARPTWYPPPSVRAAKPELPASVPPGPDNPLGEYALYLGWPRYVVHGTNLPYGVGRRVSAGCIRLYPEDIARLYPRVAVGTPVTVIDESIKLGWHERHLYIEAHPNQRQADELEATRRFTPEPVEGLETRILAIAGAAADRVDWDAVVLAILERRGIPVRVTR